MSIIAFILLVFIIVFIIVPLVKIGYGVWRARRNWNEAMNRFRQAAGYGETTNNGPAPAPTGRRKNKLDPDVGEYVAFEEITVETGATAGSASARPSAAEDQIEDVSWEDIK